MALDPFKILDEVLNTVAPTVNISKVTDLGGGVYQLDVDTTLYLNTLSKVTIDGSEYTVDSFVLNTSITVSGGPLVTASSFTLNQPLFVWGNPQMVSAEIVKRQENGTLTYPYIWGVEFSTSNKNLDPKNAVKESKSFNLFFFDTVDRENWTIEDHYNEDIEPLSNYVNYFFKILKSRRDLFNSDAITWSQQNHVNFGDYITDEGMRSKIINDNITGVQVQAEIPFIDRGCDASEIVANCVAANYQNSDASFTQSIASGDTYIAPDIELIVNTISQGNYPANQDLDVTIAVSAALKYNMPQPTWQTSYDTYDEGWHYTNDTYSNPITSTDKVVTLDPDDWYKISDDIGSLGHTYRFINENGDYYNSDDQTYRLQNGTLSNRATVFQTTFYAIDRLTGLGWYLVRGGAMNYATALTTIEGTTVLGFSDWHMPFRKQWDTILNPTLQQATYATESPIFDIQLTQHTCTPNGISPTTQHHQYNTANSYTVNRAKTNADAISFVRKHF